MARYASQIMTIWKGKPFKEGVHERMTKGELGESKAWLQEHITFMLPNEDALGIDDLLAKARQAVKRYGINGFIIDPWNEVDHKRPNYMTETEFISSSLTKIRQFARRYDVHVWIVAHPAKMIKSGEKDGKATYPIPTAYDISGSAHWYNKADNIISVYRNIHNEAQDVEINVQKVRFREVGRAGSRFFSHDIMTGRYKASISQKSFSTY
jgi:twinkle protein